MSDNVPSYSTTIPAATAAATATAAADTNNFWDILSPFDEDPLLAIYGHLTTTPEKPCPVCGKGIYPDLSHCAGCNCAECERMVVPGTKYCVEHLCKCGKNPKNPMKGQLCDDCHTLNKCPHCNRLKLSNSNVCAYHTCSKCGAETAHQCPACNCNTSGCTDTAAKDSKFCSYHRCKNTGCSGERINGSSFGYCVHCSCQYGCGRLRLPERTYCDSHACKHCRGNTGLEFPQRPSCRALAGVDPTTHIRHQGDFPCLGKLNGCKKCDVLTDSTWCYRCKCKYCINQATNESLQTCSDHTADKPCNYPGCTRTHAVDRPPLGGTGNFRHRPDRTYCDAHSGKLIHCYDCGKNLPSIYKARCGAHISCPDCSLSIRYSCPMMKQVLPILSQMNIIAIFDEIPGLIIHGQPAVNAILDVTLSQELRSVSAPQALANVRDALDKAGVAEATQRAIMEHLKKRLDGIFLNVVFAKLSDCLQRDSRAGTGPEETRQTRAEDRRRARIEFAAYVHCVRKGTYTRRQYERLCRLAISKDDDVRGLALDTINSETEKNTVLLLFRLFAYVPVNVLDKILSFL